MTYATVRQPAAMMWARGSSRKTAMVVNNAKLKSAAGTILAGFGHARIIPATATAAPRIAMLAPAVRVATSALLALRHNNEPVANSGAAPSVTRGARCSIAIATDSTL